MRYEVILEGKVRKHLERLSPDVLRRIDKALVSLAKNPRPSGVEKLTGYDLWRVRTGDYRIIYEIDNKSKKVFVYKIKHRREAYKKL